MKDRDRETINDADNFPQGETSPPSDEPDSTDEPQDPNPGGDLHFACAIRSLNFRLRMIEDIICFTLYGLVFYILLNAVRRELAK